MALAKRNNELFVEGKSQPFCLKKLPRPVFNLVLRLRDEAHRFARAYHFKLRKKKLFDQKENSDTMK
jgi:excinuclease UvrABC nuclease subunit